MARLGKKRIKDERNCPQAKEGLETNILSRSVPIMKKRLIVTHVRTRGAWTCGRPRPYPREHAQSPRDPPCMSDRDTLTIILWTPDVMRCPSRAGPHAYLLCPSHVQPLSTTSGCGLTQNVSASSIHCRRDKRQPKMADINLQEIHDHLVAIAFEAGQVIKSANTSSISQGTKLNCAVPLDPSPESKGINSSPAS